MKKWILAFVGVGLLSSAAIWSAEVALGTNTWPGLGFACTNTAPGFTVMRNLTFQNGYGLSGHTFRCDNAKLLTEHVRC